MPQKCDFSQWPIVYFTLDGKLDQAQSDMVLKGLRDALERKAAFATVTDLANADHSAKYSQDAFKDFIDQNRDELRKHCKGGALIVTSAPMRLLINTFVLLAKMPFPTRAFNTQADAKAWVSGLLKSGQLAS